MRLTVDVGRGDELRIRDKYVTIKSEGVEYMTMLEHCKPVAKHKKIDAKSNKEYWCTVFDVEKFV
jgi:hypothetical protein